MYLKKKRKSFQLKKEVSGLAVLATSLLGSVINNLLLRGTVLVMILSYSIAFDFAIFCREILLVLS